MSQSRKVEIYYDFLSEHYDAATTGKFEWTPPKEAEKLLSSRLKTESKVLDLGIGTGQSVGYLANIGCHVCGVDLSQKMLELTRAKFPQFELLKADLNSDLKILENRKFNAVLAIGVLEFVNDLKATLTKLASLIDKDGFFCFTFEEFVADHELQSTRESFSGIGEIRPGISTEFLHHRYSRAEVETMIADLGLSILEAKRFKAYYKTSKMIPIFYWIILAKRASIISGQ